MAGVWILETGSTKMKLTVKLGNLCTCIYRIVKDIHLHTYWVRVHLFGKPCLLGFWFCFTKFLSCFMLEFGECEIRKGGIVPEKGHGLMVKG